MARVPAICLGLVAAFLILVGIVDIAFLNRVEDLLWGASFFEGIEDPSQFDRPVGVLTNWIGAVLIAAGCTLVVLSLNLRRGFGYVLQFSRRTSSVFGRRLGILLGDRSVGDALGNWCPQGIPGSTVRHAPAKALSS